MFSRFGRQIFSLYERRPILMNSLVGGTVYVAGEYTIQTQSKDVRFFNNENWKKMAKLGALGSVENGVVMLTWYKILNKYVGSGVSTNIVLLKCLLDQLFFATQQDFLFLGLCAYNDADALSAAFQEVKETFVTTWIVDCSLWPVVNFIGFAFVPYILQPTYMAFVSYFWQLYLSAAAATDEKELSDAQLHVLFKALDTDNSNFIDAHELQEFFRQRKIAVTEAEVMQMIADADTIGRELIGEGHVQGDGKVSFEEFKKLATHGCKLRLKSSALWCSVREDIVLTKGAKHAMKRLVELERHQTEKRKHHEEIEQQQQLSQQQQQHSQQGPQDQQNQHQQQQQKQRHHPQHQSQHRAKDVSTASTIGSDVSSGGAVPAGPATAPPDSKDCVLVAALTAEDAAEKARHESDLAEDRAAAIHKATIGATVLTVAVLFRKLVFKL